MHKAPRLVARTEKEVTSRNSLEEVGHIFSAHRANRLIAYYTIGSDYFGRALRYEFADFTVIYQWRRLTDVVQSIAGAHRVADSPDDSFEHRWNLRVSFFTERPDCSTKLR